MRVRNLFLSNIIIGVKCCTEHDYSICKTVWLTIIMIKSWGALKNVLKAIKIETSLDGRVTIMKQKKFYSENGLLIFIWFRRNCKRFDAVVVPWVTGKWNSWKNYFSAKNWLTAAATWIDGVEYLTYVRSTCLDWSVTLFTHPAMVAWW